MVIAVNDLIFIELVEGIRFVEQAGIVQFSYIDTDKEHEDIRAARYLRLSQNGSIRMEIVNGATAARWSKTQIKKSNGDDTIRLSKEAHYSLMREKISVYTNIDSLVDAR